MARAAFGMWSAKRFMSAQVINEDEYTAMVVYDPWSFTLTKNKIGTRYALVAVRTLVDAADPKDVEKVHALQDAIKANHKAPGEFEAHAKYGRPCSFHVTRTEFPLTKIFGVRLASW
jgi:hypothetical protein